MSTTGNHPLISVVIPTCRRPDLLQRCLEALARQDLAPGAFEVIIVDDAASDATRAQVESWARRLASSDHTILYIPVTGPRHGPATARNIGWRAAHSEFIAFTDDDCQPAPDWLCAGLAAFATGAAGVSGKTILPLPSAPTDYEYNASLLAHAEFITANCFYRRDALAMIGGFDERFTAAWREDSDLHFALLQNNACLLTTAKAVVVHPIRPAQWGISLKQQRKSMFNALLYKKYPQLYRERIQAAPPWHYYCILGALLLALVSAIAGLWSLALIATIAWLLMTTRFCLHRLKHTSRAPTHIIEMVVTSICIPPLAIFWRLWGAVKYRVFFL